VTENPACVVPSRRCEIDCCAVDTSNIAVLPSVRIIVNVVSSSSLRESHAALWSSCPVRNPWGWWPFRKLLVEPEGLARDALEWQTAGVVGVRWGVHLRRLAVG
jgi:hypothetical protein